MVFIHILNREMEKQKKNDQGFQNNYSKKIFVGLFSVVPVLLFIYYKPPPPEGFTVIFIGKLIHKE